MGENLIDTNNIQYFCDTTYNAVPYSNKIWVLVAFNYKVQHSILCSLALIKNENKETFLTMYDFLEQKYKFLPNIITVDFERRGYTALKEKYPNINIILCNYHYINRIKNRIKNNYNGPEDKYNKLYNDLLSNFKLIPFINTEDLNIFIEKLKNKFNKYFKKFFNYFERNFIKNKPFNNLDWNYNKLILIIFNKKKVYQDNIFSVTRVIVYYIQKNEVLNIIDYSKLQNILIDYREYLKKNQINFNNIQLDKEFEDFTDNIKYNNINNDELNDSFKSDNFITDSEISFV